MAVDFDQIDILEASDGAPPLRAIAAAAIVGKNTLRSDTHGRRIWKWSLVRPSHGGGVSCVIAVQRRFLLRSALLFFRLAGAWLSRSPTSIMHRPLAQSLGVLRLSSSENYAISKQRTHLPQAIMQLWAGPSVSPSTLLRPVFRTRIRTLGRDAQDRRWSELNAAAWAFDSCGKLVLRGPCYPPCARTELGASKKHEHPDLWPTGAQLPFGAMASTSLTKRFYL